MVIINNINNILFIINIIFELSFIRFIYMVNIKNNNKPIFKPLIIKDLIIYVSRIKIYFLKIIYFF